MNGIKKLLGVIWMLAGPAVIIFMVGQALQKIHMASQKIEAATSLAEKSAAAAGKINIEIQWFIIILIFVPIAFGLMIFGYYALKGEYNAET